MALTADIRSLAVRLLKAHRLRFVDLRSIADPLTGTSVVVLKFRTDRGHSPKAFFDDLNENGIQYKKLAKDPNETYVVCELWPKGQKRRVTEMREKARNSRRSQENQGGKPSSNGNIPYLGIPKGEAQLNMIEGIAKDLRAAGYSEDADMLLRVAGEQDWDEFRRKMKKLFRRMKLHTRPEVRQLREHIAGEIIKELGPDAELLRGARGSDLEKRVNDAIFEHLDLVLDTRGIADSVLRRVASARTPANKVAHLAKIRRGFMSLAKMAEEAGEDAMVPSISARAKQAAQDIQSVTDGTGQVKTDFNEYLVSLVSSHKLEAAFLHLVESSYNAD